MRRPAKTRHRPRAYIGAIAFPQSTGHNGIHVNERKEMKVNQVVDNTYCEGGWVLFCDEHITSPTYLPHLKGISKCFFTPD